MSKTDDAIIAEWDEFEQDAVETLAYETARLGRELTELADVSPQVKVAAKMVVKASRVLDEHLGRLGPDELEPMG